MDQMPRQSVHGNRGDLSVAISTKNCGLRSTVSDGVFSPAIVCGRGGLLLLFGFFSHHIHEHM